MGGLSKKAFQFRALLGKHQQPSIIVDGGDLLFRAYTTPPSREKQDKATAEGIVMGYNLMGYDAVAVGRKDLAAGLNYLKKIQTKSDFSWLSANIIDPKTKKTIFKPYIIKDTGKVKIAIIGITDSTMLAAEMAAPDFRIAQWSEVLPDLVRELKKSTDFIVLLSGLRQKEHTKIAQAFPDIHLVIQAIGASNNMPPKQINNTLICSAGKQGKYFGWLQIKWHANGRWGNKTTDILAERKSDLSRLNWQLRRFKGRADSEKSKVYQSLMQTRAATTAQIKEIQQRIKNENALGLSHSTYHNTFYTLNANMPDDQKVMEIVNNIKNKVNLIGKNRTNRLAQRANKKPSQSTNDSGINLYTGWQKCSTCHTLATSTWKKTSHAQAYFTLVDKGQQFNLDCLPCHVTGVITGKEPYTLVLPPPLQQVGCEVCHGPGKKHAAQPRKVNMSSPSASVCLRCHTPEHDDVFDFQAARDAIKCTTSSSSSSH